MRTAIGLALVAAATLPACSWTQFDDLSGDAWVVSTQKPGTKSNDFGVAIQRGTRASASGGTLVVVGINQPTYSELAYSAQGDAKLSSTLDLNMQYGLGGLDNQPIVLADPSSDNIAMIVNGNANSSNSNQIVALIGTGQLELHQLIVSPSTVEAATYMQPPPRPDTSAAQPPRPLVASGEVVLGVFANPQPPGSTHLSCKLVDAGGIAIKPLALGVVRDSGDVDDVLAWGSNGKLYRYESSVFNGCTPTKGPTGPVADTSFMPGKGSQILSIDATHVVLQGHRDGDDASVLQMYNATAMTPVGAPVATGKLRTAAILDVGTDKYVIAGYPAALVSGKTAGQVVLYKISATGIETTPAATLSDAQPEDNQSFGRAVAAVPFNGTSVIAVAADNEIFAYFRANLTSGSALYGETRQGR
jgi:hypothetical protein